MKKTMRFFTLREERLLGDMSGGSSLPGMRTVEGEEKRRLNPHLFDERWHRLSRDVRAERGHRCERCGETRGRMEVDHVVEVSDGGAQFDRGNLQVLCRRCHARKTGRVAAARRRMGR